MDAGRPPPGERLLHETIDALAEHIAIVDERGVIVCVNSAWKRFARANAPRSRLAGLGAGADYLEECERAGRRGAVEAPAVAAAIRAVLGGAPGGFSADYDCHSPGKLRWFAVRVGGFAAAERRYAVLSHQDVTARRLAERELAQLAAQLEARVRVRTVQLGRAHGEHLRAKHEIRTLTRRLLESEEGERRALARELHDRIGQNLSALNVNLQLVRSELSKASAERVSKRIEEVQLLLGETTAQVRDVMAELRPPGLDDYGLVTALRNYVERIAQRHPARIKVVGENPRPRLPVATEMALFRIAQEALSNAAKHAGARQVEVRVERSRGRVRLTIADDGLGFDPRRIDNATFGLAIMRERAEAVSARLRLDSRPGKGACVTVELAV